MQCNFARLPFSPACCILFFISLDSRFFSFGSKRLIFAISWDYPAILLPFLFFFLLCLLVWIHASSPCGSKWRQHSGASHHKSSWSTSGRCHIKGGGLIVFFTAIFKTLKLLFLFFFYFFFVVFLSITRGLKLHVIYDSFQLYGPFPSINTSVRPVITFPNHAKRVENSCKYYEQWSIVDELRGVWKSAKHCLGCLIRLTVT